MIVGAVVLAAGKSEHMGQNKLLLNLNGRTLIEGILDSLAAAGVDERVIVLGHNPGQVIQAIKPRLHTLKIAMNEDYDGGMVSSFQKGLQQLPFVDATFLVLGDQPIFDPKFLELMVAQMESSEGKALIVSPMHKGKKGHPLLFHRQLFCNILDLKDRQTMCDIVHGCADRLLTVEAPWWTIMDIGAPENYGRIIGLIGAGFS